PVTTSNVRAGDRRFAGWQALDGDDATYWATDDGTLPARLELDTEGSIDIDTALLAEARGMEGRVKEYTVEGFTESAWKLLSQGTSIGERKLDRFPKVTVWKVRLTISKAEPSLAIREFGLYLDPSPAARRSP
ncbi:MAG: discoidin domain-containing protein, partial [Tepidisphaeraceae bacterium]